MEKMKFSFPYAELKKDLYRYVKFLFGGGLSLILNLIVTYILVEFLGLWHMFSFAIALTLETIFLFIYHSFVTFHKKSNFFVFAVVVLIISALNWIFVYVFTELWFIHYLISIVVVAGVISILNYTLNRNFVFKMIKENA